MLFKYIVLIILWIIIILFSFINNKNLFQKIKLPLILMLSATVANCLEILVKGQITDYVDLSKIGIDWPIFNLADIILTIGVVWLLFSLFSKNKNSSLIRKN